MIITRYLSKEILNALLGMTLVLLLIFLSKELVRYLGYAAAGKVAANVLWQLMGLEIPYLLALLLPLGLYLGIILAYGRLYADNEMYVLHACGLSERQLFAITSLLVLMVTLIVLLLTMWVNPWIASQKEKLIAHSLSNDNFLHTLIPGRFQVSNNGRSVLYVEGISRHHREATNIFIANTGNLATKNSDNNSNVWAVLSAAEGSQMRDPVSHDIFIVATGGYRYEGTPGQNDFKIVQFNKYATRLPQTISKSKQTDQDAVGTTTLLKQFHSPDQAAELQWRISIPLSVLLLSLLAIPLSKIAPRRSRYSQIFPALLIYIIYMNLLFVARNWIEQKFLPIHFGLWVVHLMVLLFAILFMWLQTGFSVKKFIGRFL